MCTTASTSRPFAYNLYSYGHFQTIRVMESSTPFHILINASPQTTCLLVGNDAEKPTISGRGALSVTNPTSSAKHNFPHEHPQRRRALSVPKRPIGGLPFPTTLLTRPQTRILCRDEPRRRHRAVRVSSCGAPAHVLWNSGVSWLVHFASN